MAALIYLDRAGCPETLKTRIELQREMSVAGFHMVMTGRAMRREDEEGGRGGRKEGDTLLPSTTDMSHRCSIAGEDDALSLSLSLSPPTHFYVAGLIVHGKCHC